MSPMSSQGDYKKEAGRSDREEDVMTETELAVMRLLAKECRQPLEAGRGKECTAP